ncbi:hypothetical protein [Micromonospora zhanjiangensis]|uniref:Uncharacterized protein n=1 Tax=Micromonospora zhanjiangensis TaxID=1522057 RepID=A0ABV8KME5_9ACTN
MSGRDAVRPGPLARWRNRRAVRRVNAIDDRFLAAEPLWREGRFAEYAEVLAGLARDYAGERRVIGALDSVFAARIRRCEALVRAGRPGLAETEARTIVADLVDLEGPDGPLRRRLRARMDAAYQGEELPYD